MIAMGSGATTATATAATTGGMTDGAETTATTTGGATTVISSTAVSFGGITTANGFAGAKATGQPGGTGCPQIEQPRSGDKPRQRPLFAAVERALR